MNADPDGHFTILGLLIGMTIGVAFAGTASLIDLTKLLSFFFKSLEIVGIAFSISEDLKSIFLKLLETVFFC